MIQLTKLSIQFNQKKIFEDTNFSANPGQITLILGPSGTGKSTLLKTLLFQYPSSYSYGNERLDQYTNEQKSLFMFEHISYVEQIPILIESLTIKEHIQFIKETYGLSNEKENIREHFSIEHLLNKYPKQLSGGERIRVAIYLAVLKDPETLILDEPTASLDSINKKIIIEYLKDYAKKGNIVICSSHDEELINESNCVYQIDNYQLKLIKEFSNENYKTSKLASYQNKLKSFFPIYLKMEKKNGLSRFIGVLLVALSVALVTLALSMNNVFIQNNQDILNNYSSTELIVYNKLIHGNPFSFRGQEFPLEDDQVEQIASIKGIDRAEWRVDVAITDRSCLFGHPLTQSNEERANYTIYQSYDGNTPIESTTLEYYYLHSYLDDVNYDVTYLYKYSEEGLIINEDQFHRFFPNQIPVEPYLEFYLMVPMYNSSGIANASSRIDETIRELPCNNITCQAVKVKLPIKAVISDDALSQEDISSANFYISRNLYQTYIEQYYPSSNRNPAWIKEYNSYFEKIPEGYTIQPGDQYVVQTQWKPNSYSIFLENLDDLSYVVAQLEKYGFGVESEYYNVTSILNIQKSTRQLFTIISICFLVIVLTTYFVIQFVYSSSKMNNFKFLYYLGYAPTKIKEFDDGYCLLNTTRLMILSFALFFIFRWIIQKNGIGFIKFSTLIAFVICSICLIIEYIYPKIIVKIKNDSIK